MRILFITIKPFIYGDAGLCTAICKHVFVLHATLKLCIK